MSKNLLNISKKTCYWRRDSHSVKKYQFIYHFLPHPQENRRATLLSVKSLVYYCIIIVLVSGLFRLIPMIFPNILGYATNINIKSLLSNTNKIRSQSGLQSLEINTKLSEAAEKKALHMFEHGYWAHIAPDGTEPWDFILSENYDYVFAGENLAKNFSSSEDVVEAWYKSQSHRENLLSGNYSQVGFAVVNGKLNGYETTLVVQMFGKPRSATQMASVTPDRVENTQPQNTVPETTAPPQIFSPPPAGSTTGFNGIGQEAEVKPLMDVRTASKSMSMLFGTFVLVLLSLDLWYTKKAGVVKLNGHTWVHLSFLLLALIGIWFVFNPGSVL